MAIATIDEKHIKLHDQVNLIKQELGMDISKQPDDPEITLPFIKTKTVLENNKPSVLSRRYGSNRARTD